ncbi:hypothetical protein [Actinoplanes sp. N902-109]|uniref:LppU/SCO3897 family protein n=1 Tax=Actinoplanes sp. (strain N902-109) TaxID=649831 RepID=UPI000329517F|nr:hypothetical protein [Actinoplanes sp. N902-109]AGL21668.1 hypothetical protein L083_8158 [Actinoplanes sp. N902-109]
MSQNGQGWPAGGTPASGEPYAAPADPWGDAAPPPDPVWGAHPTSAPPDDPIGYAPPPRPYGQTSAPAWQQQALPPRKRNGPIVAVVVVLALLIIGGLGTAAWLVSRPDPSEPRVLSSTARPSATTTRDVAAPEPQNSANARFVAKGQCVRNEGNADDSPELTIVPCASGTFEVLKRVDGRTTGEADAEGKCSKVAHYTKWYFYDSELDSLDFVLCLREYGDN